MHAHTHMYTHIHTPTYISHTHSLSHLLTYSLHSLTHINAHTHIHARMQACTYARTHKASGSYAKHSYYHLANQHWLIHHRLRLSSIAHANPGQVVQREVPESKVYNDPC